MKFNKFVKGIAATVAILTVGFIGGSATAPTAKAPTEITQAAYEATPGPYGSGVLTNWPVLSHGIYCFTNGTLNSSVSQKTNTPAYLQYTKTLSSLAQNTPGQWCPNEQVRIYGDSITFGGKSAIAAALNDKVVVVDAWSGRPTTPVADNIEAANWLPATVVIASGTNDVFNPTVMAAQIKRIQNKVSALNASRTDGIVTQLFWVDVQMTRWGQTDVIQRNDQRNSMAINLAIYQNMPTDHVIQWTQRFMSNPGLLTTYLTDGVHPKTGAGYAYWAAVIKSWLQLLGGI